jgi:Transposase DDE domain
MCENRAMTRKAGAMHVETSRSHQTRKDGTERVYQRHLLRRSYRQGGKVRKQTLANLSHLPDEAIAALRLVLAGRTVVDADAALEVARSAPHGHVAAVHTIARQLGLPDLLGPPGRPRDLAYALIVSRVVRPRSKLSTIGWWQDVTLGVDLGVAGASTDEVYAAMDWLVDRQDAIEAQLARRHLREGGIAMFDLSSSWVEGTHNQLAAFGHSRDGKRGKPQINYGLLTDPKGRPVAVRVVAGSTADPTAFTQAVEVVRGSFDLHQLILVGDRGMITTARIEALKQRNDDPDTPDGFAWITALRAPSIKKLAADDGPLQPSLFDQQDLAEITSPDYPGERLVACRNPLLASERARKRQDLLAATEALLAKVKGQVDAGRLKDPDKIRVKADRALRKHKVGKHLVVQVAQGSLSWHRDQAKIDAEAALDGIYVIRTCVPAATLDAAGAVAAYKNLAFVERDFRHIKADDLDLRPIWHRLQDRVRGHVLVCMLAGYLAWHLRGAWAPLTFTDEHPPAREDPVAPAQRSAAAQAKAAHKANGANGQPVRSFRDLLDHLATLTRDTITIAGQTIDKITTPTPTQRRAFDLLQAPIPITLA